jgi:hypothetical protein
MLKQRLAAVDAVQSTFVPAEQAADHAVVECARSIVAMLEARQAANLPLSTGLEPLSKAARAMQFLVDGRRELIETHPLLDEAARRIGISPAQYGKGEPPQAILDTQEAEAANNSC